jgi:hypothetical protein
MTTRESNLIDAGYSAQYIGKARFRLEDAKAKAVEFRKNGKFAQVVFENPCYYVFTKKKES